MRKNHLSLASAYSMLRDPARYTINETIYRELLHLREKIYTALLQVSMPHFSDSLSEVKATEPSLADETEPSPHVFSERQEKLNDYARRIYSRYVDLCYANTIAIKNYIDHLKGKYNANILDRIEECVGQTVMFLKAECGYQPVTTLAMSGDAKVVASNPATSGDAKTDDASDANKKFNAMMQTIRSVHVYCSLLGGIFYPMSQGLDPFQGGHIDEQGKFISDSGNCRGHVMHYNEVVSSKGKYYCVMRNTLSTWHHQHHQAAPQDIQFKDEGDAMGVEVFLRWDTDISTHRNWKYIADEIVEQLEVRYIYRISMHGEENGKQTGHAISVRLLPNSEKVELLDPNPGIFNLPDRRLLKDFLALLFMDYHFEWFTIYEIKLLRLERQPASAVASLPAFQPCLDINKLKKSVFLNLKHLAMQANNEFQANSLQNKYKVLSETTEYLANRAYIFLKYIEPEAQARAAEHLVAEQIVRFVALRNQLLHLPQQEKCSDDQIRLLRTAIDADAQQLKKQVCDKIDGEIRRLDQKRTGFGDSKDKKAALEILKNRILQAPATINCACIVEKWLYDKSELGDVTYKQIITKRRFGSGETITDTMRFIYRLKNQEVNIHRLDILRMKLFIQIANFLGLYKPGAAKAGALQKAIIEALTNCIPIREILMSIQKWNATDPNVPVQQLCAKMKNLDVDYPKSLIIHEHTINALLVPSMIQAMVPEPKPAEESPLKVGELSRLPATVLNRTLEFLDIKQSAISALTCRFFSDYARQRITISGKPASAATITLNISAEEDTAAKNDTRESLVLVDEPRRLTTTGPTAS